MADYVGYAHIIFHRTSVVSLSRTDYETQKFISLKSRTTKFQNSLIPYFLTHHLQAWIFVLILWFRFVWHCLCILILIRPSLILQSPTKGWSGNAYYKVDCYYIYTNFSYSYIYIPVTIHPKEARPLLCQTTHKQHKNQYLLNASHTKRERKSGQSQLLSQSVFCSPRVCFT